MGGSASATFNTPVVSVEGNIAREEVYDPDAQQITTFLVIGGDISIGPDVGFIDIVKEVVSPKEKPNPLNFSVSPYIASIYNVENVVADYSGPFIYNSTTPAYKYGFTTGEAHSPHDPERERAYSNTVGLAFGHALTTNHGASYYIPVKTRNPGQVIPTFHNPLPYLSNLASILFGD